MKIQGVDDMNYSFDTLKTLYDKYSIEKRDNGQIVIVDRKTRESFAFEGDFGEFVKFAHTWVFATRYNQSPNTLSVSKNNITDDEYGRAFSDSSRKIYNLIMESVVTCLQQTGRMLTQERIIYEIKKQINDSHVEDIVKGLFVKKGGHFSFLFWSLKVAGMDELLDRVHEHTNKQDRALAA